MSDTLVTVAMPVYGKPNGMVREAALSILAQDVPLKLVIIDDACPTFDGLPDLDDPRIVRYCLPENRGAYYAQSLALAAAKTPWWTVQDSDDTSAPRRLATMLAAAGDASAVASRSLMQLMDGTTEISPPTQTWQPGQDGPPARVIPHLVRVHHPAHLYRTEVLRTVGIPADMRTSIDTAIISLFWYRHPVAFVDDALYNVRKTEGSLTTSPDTGLGTPHRQRMRKETKARFRAAVENGRPLRGAAPEPGHVRELAALL